MRTCRILPILMYAAAAGAVQAATLYYASSAPTQSDLYSIDTATGAQKLEMTLPGAYLSGLTSSPVPGALYGLQVVSTSLSWNYECLHLIEPRIKRDRLVSCELMIAQRIAFDARRDVLYGGVMGLSTLNQRTAAQQGWTAYPVGGNRGEQGMTLAVDTASDTLYGSGWFRGGTVKGFYTIDRTTAAMTQLGTSSYRALFVDPASGAMYGIAPDLNTEGTPELHAVNKSTGAGTRIAALVATGAINGLAALPPEPPTIVLAEYYHAAFDHYFVTGDPAEIKKLDSGAFPGWLRTGELYTAFLPDAFGTANTCRFFSTAFAPKSSHFYAADARECATVKQNPSWLFEGESFAQIPVPPDGDCAAGLVSLFRLYNNGQGGAPAHRYVVRDVLRSQQMERGWVPEGSGVGTVACVVPGDWLPDSAEGAWMGRSTAGGYFDYQEVFTAVLEDGRVYQLYFDSRFGQPDAVGGLVVGKGAANRGTFETTSARRYDSVSGLVGWKTSRAPTTLSAVYTPESGIGGRADGRAAFGAAYQVGYQAKARVASVAGQYAGWMFSMFVGTDITVLATMDVANSGAFSGAVGACKYGGTLAPHGNVNVFDLVVTLDAATCPSATGPMRGVAYFDTVSRKLFAVAENEGGTDAFGFAGPKQ